MLAPQAHFSALATLTGNYTGGEIRVNGATNWSAATWDNGSKTLGISGSSDVSGGDVIMAAGTTLSVRLRHAGGRQFRWFANYGTLPSAVPPTRPFPGRSPVAVALAKSGNGTLTLNGSISYKGGTTVTGGTLELPGGDWRRVILGLLAVPAGPLPSVPGPFFPRRTV